ncbi:gamma carbonic anhydrase family protein [Nocardioides euryhalodurans]|uniref:Gamma carbonic anhydrase family protein n=1 Tax=Nocardioides euryhalodurans TaxID=2518370 RepID=A0A4P7GPH7_9ACTN|nr:gamma carbonic anhydrase family protein [Nocardioides euryhalodurans]QBR93697.1 gamma carbonic anhydrase family protein [Nocardioides euryhalodurans]
MTGTGAGARLVPYGGAVPEVDPEAFVADGATLVGAVRLGAGASVWFSAVVRGDGAPIEVGEGSNVQDGSVLHSDPTFPVTVGRDVTIGHRAVVHGCTIGDGALVGMGAVLLNGVELGAGSLVAAGSVVLEGTVVPPGSLVAGVPGRVKRPVTDAERERMRSGTASYVTRARAYREASSGA